MISIEDDQKHSTNEFDSYVLNAIKNVNPILNLFRIPGIKQNWGYGFLSVADKSRIFYRELLPKSTTDIEKIVVCIHGLHSHGEKFIILADRFLKNNWATYSLDLRGHGLSWKNAEERGDIENWRLWVKDIFDFLSFLSEKYPQCPIHLLAESMGAAAAVHAAMLNPPQLKSLIFLSPALKPIRQVRLTMAMRSLAYGALAPDKTTILNRGKGVLTSNTEAYQEYQIRDPLRLERVTPRYYFQVLEMLTG